MALSKPKLPVGGLSVGPNDLDAPPGDFLVAENVVHRRAGILEPLPGENYFSETLGWQYSRVFSDWEPTYALKLRKQTADEFAQLMDPSDSSNTTVYASKFLPGETQCVYADGRHILSGAEHVVVVDNLSSDTCSAPRRAGLPQLNILTFASLTDTTGTALQPTIAANKFCAYVAIVRRKLQNDRFLQSAPTSAIYPASHLVPINPVIAVYFDQTLGLLQEGDEIRLYRTAQEDSVAAINGTFYLAATHTLDNSDLSTGIVSVQDNTLETNLGEELYTNPGREGSLKANIVPPRSSGVETYRNTTFYINKRAQPNVSATVVGQFGTLPLVVGDVSRQQRQNGIGVRTFYGDFTLGSKFVTNVAANYRVGLAVGQMVSAAALPNDMQIVAITGAGPYTLELTGNASVTSVFLQSTATDTLTVTATKGGTTSTSQVVIVSNLFELQAELLTLADGSSVRMPGFVANIAGMADMSGSVQDQQVLLNVSVTEPDYWDSFTLSFTNPNNWVYGRTSGDYRLIDSVQETRRNVVWYSKTNLPEDVSPVQFILVGAGTVHRLLNTQSSMLAFCSDGLFRIEGQGDTWSVTPVDSAVRLVHPDCAAATGAVGYAWLESGFSAVNETGVQNIGRDAIGPQLEAHVKALYAASGGPRDLWGPSLVIDRHSRECWLNIVTMVTGAAAAKRATYIFNTDTGKFTTAGYTYTALSYSPKDLTLLRARNGTSGDGIYLPAPGLPEDYLPATVVYLPVVDNAGEVKQWVDVNYFFDAVPETATGLYTVEALFGGELTSSTNMFELNASQAPGVLFALHALVPRRSARDVELTFGFRTSIVSDSAHPSGGYYFQFKGASVRVRRAGQIIKR